MKLCCSKTTHPGVFLKTMITISTGKGTWVLASPPPSGVAMASYSYENFLGTLLKNAPFPLTSPSTVLLHQSPTLP